MNTRVSFTKQEIKQDKFAEFVGGLRDSLSDNLTYILGGIAVVILIVGGVYFYQDSREASLARAYEQMAEAKTKISLGNLQTALLELRSIADENSGTDLGAEALYLLGSAHYLNKNFEEARKAFEEYANRYSDNRISYSAALAGIASCMENSGEYASAAGQFVKALDADPEGPGAQDNALGALRNYLLAGDRASAENVRQRIYKDFWRTSAVSAADRLFYEIKPAA